MQPRKTGQPHRGWKSAARKRHSKPDSAVDAALFRTMFDALFHNCPMNAELKLEPNDYARKIWSRLSEHTYRDGKRGPMEARELLKKAGIDI